MPVPPQEDTVLIDFLDGERLGILLAAMHGEANAVGPFKL